MSQVPGTHREPGRADGVPSVLGMWPCGSREAVFAMFCLQGLKARLWSFHRRRLWLGGIVSKTLLKLDRPGTL